MRLGYHRQAGQAALAGLGLEDGGHIQRVARASQTRRLRDGIAWSKKVRRMCSAERRRSMAKLDYQSNHQTKRLP
jgi:hypothetical protein